jgi:hypothetical protein
VTDQLSPALLRSPAFLLVALVAGRATSDKALTQLAVQRLADLGIKVSITPGRPRRAGRKAVHHAV